MGFGVSLHRPVLVVMTRIAAGTPPDLIMLVTVPGDTPRSLRSWMMVALVASETSRLLSVRTASNMISFNSSFTSSLMNSYAVSVFFWLGRAISAIHPLNLDFLSIQDLGIEPRTSGWIKDLGPCVFPDVRCSAKLVG